MDDSSRQLLLGTFAYLVVIGGLISTLGQPSADKLLALHIKHL